MPALATELNSLLKDFVLEDAFAQTKDEATLVFSKSNEQLTIKLNTSAKSGLLFFYEHKAERNNAVYPLFKQLLNAKVDHVFAHQNNRSFALEFSNGLQLVFKLYGPLSNLVLFNVNKVIGLFRQAIENDWLLQKNEFDQPNFEQELEPMPAHYYIYAMEAEGKRKIVFSFEPIEGIALLETLVIFEALTFFARTYLAEYQFQLKKQEITGKYQQALKRQQSLLHGAQTRMHYLQTQVPPDEIANIIMANLHVLKKEETEVNLFDFYRDQNITIKLKKEWSPQKNAELYYKKAKNKKLEWEQAEQQIEKSTLLIRQISEQLAQALNITQTKEFKKFDQETSFINSGSKNNMNNEHGQPHEMFKLFTCNGYSIYVGKNAANNDQLTLKFAKKEDLWLHARGVSGSHVVIKHKNKDTPFPASVIEFAAQLAAYYSKAKSSSLVPVIYTCKKFVRKPKGALPGQVKVEKEEVLLVEPKLPIKDA